jgi:chaperonin cofactor prefoldin
MTHISTEHLKEINDLRSSLSAVLIEAGQLALQLNMTKQEIRLLEERIEDTTKTFGELLAKEDTLVKRLSETYGPGSIDFETGELLPES